MYFIKLKLFSELNIGLKYCKVYCLIQLRRHDSSIFMRSEDTDRHLMYLLSRSFDKSSNAPTFRQPKIFS